MDGREAASRQRLGARGLRMLVGTDVLDLPARPQDVMVQVDEIARETPGVAHAVGIAGMSFLMQANGSNFGSMFIVLEPFDLRQAPELRADAIIPRLLKKFQTQ